MKRWTVMLVLVVAAVLPLTGCASETIDTWADRGSAGVVAGKQNIVEFSGKLQTILNRQKQSDVDAAFSDVLAVAQGQIKGEDGKPIKIDAAWIEAHKAGFAMLMAGWEQDEAALDAATKQALENLNQVDETFFQIKRLRRAWGRTEEIQAQVDHLTTLVERMLVNQMTAAPK